MNIFFTSPFTEKDKYKKYIDTIFSTIESTGSKVVSPGITREYADAFSEENFKKYGDKNRIHYEFIRLGIANADAVIIESSEEDFRVGHEATLAIIYKKPVLCLSQKQDFGQLIYHEGFIGKQYTDEADLQKIILDFISQISNRFLQQRHSSFALPSKQSPRIKSDAKTIVTLGSINMDMITKVPEIPEVNDVVISEGLKLLPGGKATNAAIGMARLNQIVYLLGRIGNDAFGNEVRNVFKRENVNDMFLDSDPFVPTGTVIVTVNEEGKNTIVVNEDANIRISKKSITDLLQKIDDNQLSIDCFYVTLEAPSDIITFAIEEFSKRDILIFLDAAPQARPIDKKYYKYIDFLSANEFEASAMTGIHVKDVESAKQAALVLRTQMANTIIITLGKTGSIILGKDTSQPQYFPGKKIKTIDETAAGDAFRAAFVTEYLASNSIEKAMQFGNMVGAYATTRLGSYEALPTREELEFVDFID